MSPTFQRLSWGCLLAAALLTAPALATPDDKKSAQSASSKEVAQHIANLGASDFQAREAAVAGLIRAGRAAVPPLTEAVLSSDPEIAWRAATALEAIGMEGDEATLNDIKNRIEKLKGTPHRDLAQILGSLTQRWSQIQQIKAQQALVRMGAVFPTSSSTPTPFLAPGEMETFDVVILSSSRTRVIPSLGPGKIEFDPFASPSEPPAIIESEEAEEAAPDAAAPAGEAAQGVTKEASDKASAAEEEKKADSAKETDEEPADAPVLEEVAKYLPGGVSAVDAPIGVNGVIRIDQNWTGGDRGLAYLAALPHIAIVEIQDAPLTDKAVAYFEKIPSVKSIQIRGSQISPEALIKLTKKRTDMSVRGVSRGVLGVNAGAENEPCIITMVRPGSPAGDAGLIPGDQIIRLDGEEVETFSALTLLMKDKNPGDEVKITLKRNGKTLERTLHLGDRDEITSR